MSQMPRLDESPAPSPSPSSSASPASSPASSPEPSRRRGSLGRRWWVAGLGIAALVVIVLAPLASSDPDGLESVAEEQGWLATALDPVYRIIPDYTVPGLDGNLSSIVAGLIGVAIVFGLVFGLGWLMRRRRPA